MSFIYCEKGCNLCHDMHPAASGKEPNQVALSLLNAQLSKMSQRTNIRALSIRKLQEVPTVYHLVEAD